MRAQTVVLALLGLVLARQAWAFDEEDHEAFSRDVLAKECRALIEDCKTTETRELCNQLRQVVCEPLTRDVAYGLNDARRFLDANDVLAGSDLECTPRPPSGRDHFRNTAVGLGLQHSDYCPVAGNVFSELHAMALKRASLAAADSDPQSQLVVLRDAVRLELYALHFYLDHFSPGHLIGRAVPPRYDWDPRTVKNTRNRMDAEGVQVRPRSCESGCGDDRKCFGACTAAQAYLVDRCGAPNESTHGEERLTPGNWWADGSLARSTAYQRCRMHLGAELGLEDLRRALLDEDFLSSSKTGAAIWLVPECPSDEESRDIAAKYDSFPKAELGFAAGWSGGEGWLHNYAYQAGYTLGSRLHLALQAGFMVDKERKLSKFTFAAAPSLTVFFSGYSRNSWFVQVIPARIGDFGSAENLKDIWVGASAGLGGRLVFISGGDTFNRFAMGALIQGELRSKRGADDDLIWGFGGQVVETLFW